MHGRLSKIGVRGVSLAAVVGAVLAGAVQGVAMGQAVDPVNVGGGGAATAPAATVPAVVEVPEIRVVPEGGKVEVPGVGSGAVPPTSTAPRVERIEPVEPVPGVPGVVPEVKETRVPEGTTPPTATAPTAVVEVIPQVVPTTMVSEEGTGFLVTGIKVDYKVVHPQQPPIEELLNTEITLGVVGDGFVAARPGMKTVKVKLSDIGKDEAGPRKIYRSGIAAIYGHIVRYFNTKSIIGVFVVVDANDIDLNDKDIRPADRTTLQFVVVTSTVKQVRTVSIGEGTGEADRVDSDRFKFVRDRSPLKPWAGEGATEPRIDLLNKEVLDEYVLRLNRHAGRRVDVAVSGTNDPGGVNLDYLVSESRPWYAFFQISNTGTKQTDLWRERFGYVNNQLTGHDDVLALDYMTAAFEASHAVIASYELPFFNMEQLRYRAYGSWNSYTASDVGQSLERFTGDEYTLGNELIWNVYQQRELFVDLAGGLRYQHVTAENPVALPAEGEIGYVEPYLSLRMDRTTEIATTTGALSLVGYYSNGSTEGLGRADVSKDPTALQFDFTQSIYLEPYLDTKRFVQGNSTLAHELFFSFKGQYGFGYRFIPQLQDTAGGFFSVRGYPESIQAGDTVLNGSMEYRFHLPRVLTIQSDPTLTPFMWDKSFRMSPQQAYGKPDWDLILRTFLDGAVVLQSSRQVTEHNATLLGTGVGMELQFKQNFNLRVDWGVALTGIEDLVSAGSNRFHISATFLY